MVAVALLLAACAPALPRDTAGPPPRPGAGGVDLSSVAIEDLMNVRGIGEASFLKLKPLVTVTQARLERAGTQSQ